MTQFLVQRRSHSVRGDMTVLPPVGSASRSDHRWAHIIASFPDAIAAVWCACTSCGYHIGAMVRDEYGGMLPPQEDIEQIHVRLLVAFTERDCLRPRAGEVPADPFAVEGRSRSEWGPYAVPPPRDEPDDPLRGVVGFPESARPSSPVLRDAVPMPGMVCALCHRVWGPRAFVQSPDVWPPR